MARELRLVALVSDSGKSELDDVALAQALIAGESWAPAATWKRYAALVYNMASRALGNEYEAEDVTQEVFYRLFARSGTLRKPEALRSFVVSFAIRILKWELRRKRAGRLFTLLASKDLPDAPFRGADPEARDTLRRFYAALDRLGTRERIVFALRRLESWTFSEIADVMELSLSTVKRSYGRAEQEISRWIVGDPDLVGLMSGGGRHV
jgi:RNA polymerase sigma-70 factor (ECF subfamily)